MKPSILIRNYDLTYLQIKGPDETQTLDNALEPQLEICNLTHRVKDYWGQSWGWSKITEKLSLICFYVSNQTNKYRRNFSDDE